MDPQKACGSNDEGLFVIIVDDENGKQELNKEKKIMLETIKEISANKSPSASKCDDGFVESINKLKNDIKFELETEDLESEPEAMDEEYLFPEIKEESTESEEDVNQRKSKAKPQKRRMTLLHETEQKSFVNELRKKHPELNADKAALIKKLSRIMTEIKCPTLPDNFAIEIADQFKCETCGIEKESKPAIARHWREKHGPRYLICYACGVDFRSKTNLYKHEKRCNSPDALIVLEARALNNRDLNIGRPFILPGENTPKIVDSYISLLCQKQPELAADKELLIQALTEKMTEEKPPDPPKDAIEMVSEKGYRCKSCGNTNKFLSVVVRHWQSTHGPRYLECYACKKDFRDSRSLYKHEKRCTIPDAYSVLQARSRIVGGKGRGRPYALPSPFKSKKDEWKCSICSAQFKNQKSLQAHQLAHKGLRPYRCDQCPAAYTSSSALSRHKLKHKNMTYLCDKCDRSFNCKNTLRNHMNSHLPQQKHACPHCEKRYAQKMMLRVHIDRVHRNLPPSCACQVCPKRYFRMSHLKDHMLKKHGMTLITRNMFYRTLPHLSDSQLKSAKIIRKSDLDPTNQNTEETAKETKNLELCAQEIETTVINDMIDENAPQKINDLDQTSVEYLEDETDEWKKSKEEEINYGNTTNEMDVSELLEEDHIEIKNETEKEDVEKPPSELLEYVKILQEDSAKPKPLVVIKDGQAIFIDNNNVNYYKRNITKATKTVINQPKNEVEESVTSAKSNTIVKEDVIVNKPKVKVEKSETCKCNTMVQEELIAEKPRIEVEKSIKCLKSYTKAEEVIANKTKVESPVTRPKRNKMVKEVKLKIGVERPITSLESTIMLKRKKEEEDEIIAENSRVTTIKNSVTSQIQPTCPSPKVEEKKRRGRRKKY